MCSAKFFQGSCTPVMKFITYFVFRESLLMFSSFSSSSHAHPVKLLDRSSRKRSHRYQGQLIRCISSPLELYSILPRMPACYKIKRYGLSPHMSKHQVTTSVCMLNNCKHVYCMSTIGLMHYDTALLALNYTVCM